MNSWKSKTGTRIANKNGTAPTYNTDSYGIPTIDFGNTGSKKDMSFTEFSNIKTVFWVIKIENNVKAFLLGGSAYHFHRGESVATYAAGHFKQQAMWNGLDEIVATRDIPNPNRFHVICAKMSQDCKSNSLTKDRTATDRTGGRQLSELICFSRHLTDEERVAVTKYLQRKWGIAGGELHIDVEEGETSINSTVALSGGLKLIKKGKGAFTASKAGQSYFGGTVVEEGSVTLGTSSHPLGAGDGTQYVTVNEGSSLFFDGKANTSTCCYNFNLGGTLNLNNSLGAYNQGYEPIGTRLNLLCDAHIEGNGFTFGSFNKLLTIRPNGHTLFYDGGYSWAKNVVTEGPGMITYTKGHTEVNANFNIQSAGISFTSESYTHLGDQGYSTGDFRYDVSYWDTHRTASPIHIYGRYVAGPVRPWLTLHDGATIDLSEMNDTWDMTGVAPSTGGANRRFSAEKNNGNGAIAILNNSTYTIDVGDREFKGGEQIVKWSAMPNSTVKFNLICGEKTSEEREIDILLRDDGIYVKSLKTPSYARWDVTAEEQGWKFYYKNGDEAYGWTDGVTSEMAVHYYSYAEYEALKNENVSPHTFVIAGKFEIGDGDAEMMTRVDCIADDAVIDLRGHKLSLSTLKGFGTITDTTADAAKPGELHIVVSSGELNNSEISFTGNMKVVKDGDGTLVMSKQNQSYTGGTLVKKGILKLGTSQNPLGSGNGTCSVNVEEGAEVDINNKANTSTCRYKYYLAGSVKLSGDDGNWTWDVNKSAFSRIELLGDASIGGQYFFIGIAFGYIPMVLNGHTLTMTGTFWRGVKSEGSGKIVFLSGVEMNNEIDLQTIDLEYKDGASVHLGDGGFKVGGFKWENPTKFEMHKNACQMTVYGRYVANAMRPWMTMASGSILDLSEVSGTWNSDGEAASSSTIAHRSFTTPGLVLFNGDITVLLGNRDVSGLKDILNSDSPYLVTWTKEPSATFTLDEESYEKGFRIKADATGLKLDFCKGLFIFVR